MPDDSNFNLGDYQPSFIEDGYGISGPQTDYVDETVQNWDLNAWSDQSQTVEDFISGSGSDCSPSDPPMTGMAVWGAVDGVCQWIDTTECS